jgi:UDP-glucuronate 4-epimerase
MKILVTGNAGFIGFQTAQRLLRRGDSVVGIDSVNDYYDPALKEARLKHLADAGGDYVFYRASLADREAVEALFKANRFDRVINLAAQAGVRHSLVDPMAYVDSNIVGFTNVLEACRHNGIAHLTYASTSSVYGGETRMPFSESQAAVHPLQFYAATKRANELMAHSYSHLFRLPTTGLRFFTVYGPWGRPDMAFFRFTRNIIAGEPIELFNFGDHTRDFTYVDDVVEAVIRASDSPAEPDPNWNSNDPDPGTSNAPFRLLNVGSSHPVNLADYVAAIEKAVGRKAITHPMPMQPGDVPDSTADTTRLADALGYRPRTGIDEGIAAFVAWYRDYYGV